MRGRFLVKVIEWAGAIVLSGLSLAVGLENQPAPVPSQTFNDGTVAVESPGNTLKGVWKPHNTRLLELLDGYVIQKPVAMDAYGGRLDTPAKKATGFFYQEKIGNRWWLIDPDGHPYFNIGVDSVTPLAGPQSQASRDAFNEKFGTEQVWKEKTLDFLHGIGFLGLGNWSDNTLLRTGAKPLPYTVHMDFMAAFGTSKGLTLPASGHSGYVNGCFPVFLPDFEQFCDERAKVLADTANDPYLLGIFSDNELLAPHDMLDRHLALDVNQPNLKPGHDAAVAWLAARGTDPKAITDQDRDEFMAFVFDRYCKIVSSAIRKYDPNHLNLGSRVFSRKTEFSNAVLWKVMGQYLDVISVNDYGAWGPNPVEVNHWVAWSNKPILITEWYAKALDTPGLANAHGAGWVVRTQEDRGKFYQHFMLGCFESGNIVGAHFFKYQDDPAESVALDRAGGSNKGLLNVQYEPYAPLADRAQAVNQQVYSLIDFFDRRK